MKGGLSVEVLFWACAFVLFVIAEIATVQLVSIWLAAGAFVTLLFTYFFESSLLEQLVIFIIASGFFLAVTFPFIKKLRNKGYVSTNSELDVGQKATVIEQIDENKGTGRVTLKGVDWSAVPAVKGEILPVGSIVTVNKVGGATLEVTLVHED